MHQQIVSLILSLFTFHLASKCWAQETTPTIDTLDIMTITTATPTSDNIPNEIIADATSDSTVLVTVESPTPTPPESPSSELLPPPTSDPTSSQGFFAKLNAAFLWECSFVTIKWTGTDLIPPFRVSYSKGMGDLGDASILGEETVLGFSTTYEFMWQVPPTASSKYLRPCYTGRGSMYSLFCIEICIGPFGNVARFVVMENGGTGRIAITCECQAPHVS
jgi:hypothetical protein